MGTDAGPATTASRGPQPPANPRATPLSDAEFHAAPGAVDDVLDATYRWDAGEAMGAFLEAMFEGRIVATICEQCGRTLVPPRKFCERCFRPTDTWTDVEAVGTVQTFSICHVRWDMVPLDPPELPAVIRLDGASQGGFLHKLGEVDPERVAIDMAVEAVWKPLDDRAGSILDIAYFRPRGVEA
jgi:hypothetical protein